MTKKEEPSKSRDSSACENVIPGEQGLQGIPGEQERNGKAMPRSKAIMTFGFGEFKCPGQQIATVEIKLIILFFLKSFRLKIDCTNAPDFDIKHVGFGVYPPNTDVTITVASPCDAAGS